MNITQERDGVVVPHVGAEEGTRALGDSSPPAPTTVDAWLEWFATSKKAACRAYLCTRYHLNVLDAAALINDALLQVFLHWDTIETPMAYFCQTLRHAVSKQKQRHVHERQRLVAYAQQRRLHACGTARTAQHVTDLLERVSPRQCQILKWFARGYEDPQVATWLGATPPAVRVARHNAYRALRAQLRPPEHDGRHLPCLQ